jgi:hypothetical protein
MNLRLKLVVLVLVAACCMFFLSCGGSNPAAATPDPTPNEIEVSRLAYCYAEDMNVHLAGVQFFDDCSEVVVQGETLCAAGRADLIGRVVKFWRPWVNGEKVELHEWSLPLLAAHEVCHLAFGSSEDRAAGCAMLKYQDGVCRRAGTSTIPPTFSTGVSQSLLFSSSR